MNTLEKFLNGIKSADNSAYTQKEITTKLVKLLVDIFGDSIKFNPETNTLEVGTNLEVDGNLQANSKVQSDVFESYSEVGDVKVMLAKFNPTGKEDNHFHLTNSTVKLDTSDGESHTIDEIAKKVVKNIDEITGLQTGFTSEIIYGKIVFSHSLMHIALSLKCTNSTESSARLDNVCDTNIINLIPEEFKTRIIDMNGKDLTEDSQSYCIISGESYGINKVGTNPQWVSINVPTYFIGLSRDVKGKNCRLRIGAPGVGLTCPAGESVFINLRTSLVLE